MGVGGSLVEAPLEKAAAGVLEQEGVEVVAVA